MSGGWELHAFISFLSSLSLSWRTPPKGADLSDQVPVAKEEVDSICLPEKEVNEEVDQKEEVKQVEQEAKAVELEVEQKEDQEVKEAERREGMANMY